MAIRTIIFPLAFYKAEAAAAEFQTHSSSLTDSTRPIITTPIIRILAFDDSTLFRNDTIRHSES